MGEGKEENTPVCQLYGHEHSVTRQTPHPPDVLWRHRHRAQPLVTRSGQCRGQCRGQRWATHAAAWTSATRERRGGEETREEKNKAPHHPAAPKRSTGGAHTHARSAYLAKGSGRLTPAFLAAFYWTDFAAFLTGAAAWTPAFFTCVWTDAGAWGAGAEAAPRTMALNLSTPRGSE